MVCRHRPGDPDCSSNGGGAVRLNAIYEREQYAYKLKELEANSPDASKYAIERVERVGAHLVLEVLYPNCAKCSYEGRKVMVFLNVSEMDALRWRRIDPHFRDPTLKVTKEDAPAPAARFPASDEGWKDAITFADNKRKA